MMVISELVKIFDQDLYETWSSDHKRADNRKLDGTREEENVGSS